MSRSQSKYIKITSLAKITKEMNSIPVFVHQFDMNLWLVVPVFASIWHPSLVTLSTMKPPLVSSPDVMIFQMIRDGNGTSDQGESPAY